jgi:hypothetical protein
VRNTDLYWTQSKPSDSQFVTQKLWIDPNTGHPPPPNQQVDGLVLEEKTMLQDPVTSFYCYDCNQKTDESGKPIYSSQTVKIINGKVVKENAPITPASTND